MFLINLTIEKTTQAATAFRSLQPLKKLLHSIYDCKILRRNGFNSINIIENNNYAQNELFGI